MTFGVDLFEQLMPVLVKGVIVKMGVGVKNVHGVSPQL